MTKEEAIKNIKEHCYFANLIPRAKESLDMAIKSLGQEDILDKIRAEIEFKSRIVLKDTPNDDWTVKWNECIKEVLEIIDKYKSESEANK